MIEEIPSGWKKEQLGKACLKTIQKDPRNNPDAAFMYIDVSSVSNQSFSIVETKSIMGKEAPSRARKLVRKNDVIFATVRPTLKRIAKVPPKHDGQICSTGFCVLRADNNQLDPDFLYFNLLTDKISDKVEGLQKGATYPAISDSDLFGQQIFLPPLPEQRAISRVLRAVQQAREARLREIALERERKAALMEHLFRHGTRGEATKETEIGEMPESWEVLRLGDAITLHRGFDLPQKDRLPGNVPIISSSGITGTHAKAKIKGPGVVTGRYGTIGEVFYISQDFWPLNTTLFVSEFNGNYPLFILYFLQTIKLSSFNDKTSVPGINRNHVHALIIGLPTVQEQQSIASCLMSCDAKIAALEHEAHLHDELFRAMLEELMTGRLRAGALAENEAKNDLL